MWLYAECVARWMASLCAEREAWTTMSPSRQPPSAYAATGSNASIARNLRRNPRLEIRPDRHGIPIGRPPPLRSRASSISGPSAMHFLLFYTYVPNVLERRPQFRSAHLAHARAAIARGELKLAGAFAEPVDGAALFFSADSKKVVEAFATHDPYVTGGLVTKWTVREWTTVVGEGAAHPLPPGL